MPRHSTLVVITAFVALVLGACAGSPAPAPSVARAQRVLFVGNSLTYTHDLPRTIADLARSVDAGPVVYQTIAAPNYSLEDHWHNGITKAIAEGAWQLVVMQQGPSSLADSAESLRYWAVQLDSAIQAAGARSALYQVWPSRQYLGSFDAVRRSYDDAAKAVGGMFVPAGAAWINAWAIDPSLELYGPDAFHPSALGVYLTALVHFEMICGRSALDLPKVAVVNGVRLDVPPATVLVLQQAAHAAVREWGRR